MKPKLPFIARKRFGQNFLHDPNIIQEIQTAIQAKPLDWMIEIGPGRGALTAALLKNVDHLSAIEIDHSLIDLLSQEFKNEIENQQLMLVNQDVLKFDFMQFYQEKHEHEHEHEHEHKINTKAQASQKLRIIGNLPYNISTPILFTLLPLHSIIQDMHFMLQKELVERIIATPGSKDYGRLTIMVQFFCVPSLLFIVPPQAFRPAPKVTSAFLRLVPHQNPPFKLHNMAIFKEITALAFQQRRKTLANGLKRYLNPEDLITLEIPPKIRAEELDLGQFVKISNYIYDKQKTYPSENSNGKPSHDTT